jgi:hypothetical protein
MKFLDKAAALDALRQVGATLRDRAVKGPIRLVIAGSAAGILGGFLPPSRTTGDCDVLWIPDDPIWKEVAAAAQVVGQTLNLPESWLNRNSTMYAWGLPLGWRERCESVGTFGPLEIVRLSRRDLIAAKVVSSPRRPHDVQDLRDMRPTSEELDFAAENLDRLAAEHLDRYEFEDERATLESLRQSP